VKLLTDDINGPHGKYALDIGFKSRHSGPDRLAICAPSHFGEVRHG
jgi:hypothetical protein